MPTQSRGAAAQRSGVGQPTGLAMQNVPALPPGLSYVQVAASSRHAVARRSDGSAVAWG
jgi:hypothetical protein